MEFKTYDIRGIVEPKLDANFVHKLSYALQKKYKKIIVGLDTRASSLDIFDEFVKVNNGAKIETIWHCGTEEVYYMTSKLENKSFAYDLGVMITASHNPIEYNGFKFIKSNGVAFTKKDLDDLKEEFDKVDVSSINFYSCDKESKLYIKEEYIELEYIEFLENIVKPRYDKNVVVNCSYGAVSYIMNLVPNVHVINGTMRINYPKGVPSLVNETMKQETKDAILKHNASFGVAFDGDFDRCFFFDSRGNMISGYHIGILLAKEIIKNGKILIDTRLQYGSLDLKSRDVIVDTCKTGHVYFKEKMRKGNYDFGFENSGHYYFKDFNYCDSGILPFLYMMNIEDFETKIDRIRHLYPCIEETNFVIKENENLEDVFEKVKTRVFEDLGDEITYKNFIFDGMDVWFDDWRCSVRISNTENMLRLNLECRDVSKLKTYFNLMKNLILYCGAQEL